MGGLISTVVFQSPQYYAPKTYATSPRPWTDPSTTARSSNDAEQPDSDIQLESIQSGDRARFKELIINNASPLNLRVLGPGSEEGLFFVANTMFTFNGPHVVLHAGPDKLGPVLGVIYLPQSGENTVGLGDPKSNLNSVVWERLVRTSTWTHSTYQFEFIFGEEGRKSFIWKRVCSNPFDDQPNLELFEDGNPGITLAKYESIGVFKWKKRGRMLIMDGYGDAWELIVLLTGLALVQLSRRRARQRRR